MFPAHLVLCSTLLGWLSEHPSTAWAALCVNEYLEWVGHRRWSLANDCHSCTWCVLSSRAEMTSSRPWHQSYHKSGLQQWESCLATVHALCIKVSEYGAKFHHDMPVQYPQLTATQQNGQYYCLVDCNPGVQKNAISFQSCLQSFRKAELASAGWALMLASTWVLAARTLVR